MTKPLLKPLIEQRADPFIWKHTDGSYYFTASIPLYDGIELRRAETISGLVEAEARIIWKKPDAGPWSELIWAPEVHHLDGCWYIYFAASHTREIKDGLFQHRMYAIACRDKDPMAGKWEGPVRIDSGLDTFCLDATVFRQGDALYYLWAQKHPDIEGNSNLYLARMKDPLNLETAPVMLSKPEYNWETRGFSVNEGPGILRHGARIFITYSASATDENYAVGLLWADANANLLDPESWSKSREPVFRSCPEHRVYGPGHNSFTRSEDGQEDVLVYHARTYTEIVGDPLWDPNRHTFVKRVQWSEDGFPDFGRPSEA
ncbi:MAG: family 43 glycosylhydrolase [Opitutales bacterium]|nr:family 43 glycosylhydrolase [Opitutales bacterium]